MKEYKSIFRDMFLCCLPVIILAVHLRFGMDIPCFIAYSIAVMISTWRYCDVLGDLGRMNILVVMSSYMPFVMYFAIKAFPGTSKLNPQLQNAPIACAFVIMSGLIYAGYYALRLQDGTVRYDPDSSFKNR